MTYQNVKFMKTTHNLIALAEFLSWQKVKQDQPNHN